MKKHQLPEFKLAYGSWTDDQLAVRFKTSTSVVRRLARQCGLAKCKATFPGTVRMPRWTGPDKAYLFKHYAKKSNHEIARHLGRSTRSVLARASRFGLKKSEARLRAMGVENVAKRRR